MSRPKGREGFTASKHGGKIGGMIDRYVRLEQALMRQDARQVAHGLIVFQIVGAALLLILGDGEQDVTRATAMLAGMLAIVAGLWLHGRSPFWGKVVIGLGGFPATFFFTSIHAALGVLAVIIYVIVLLVSFVA